MKIAITADLHLRAQDETPNRYDALRDILNQLVEKKITDLIIAGDLFDKDATNFSDFENLLKEDKYTDMKLWVIRGNHDINLRDRSFVADNITVMDDPQIKVFEDDTVTFLFIPYQENTTMGEVVADFKENLPEDDWVLIGHGDYIEGLKEPDPYEKGSYMQLSRKDIQEFKPLYAFLGHIHKPQKVEKVIYTGSPSPIQINETGPRRYLVFDSTELTLVSHRVRVGQVNFVESLMVLPVDDERALVESRIEEMVKKWEDNDVDPEGVLLRLKLNGYSKSPKNLKGIIESKIKELKVGEVESIDYDDLHSIDAKAEKVELVKLAKEHMQTQEWTSDDITTPTSDEVLLQIQKIIFEA